MKQLELPFTKRGRRDQRRLRGINRRAFKCWHKDRPNAFVHFHASDSSFARNEYLKICRDQYPGAKFTDIRANRSPERDKES